MNNQTKSQTKSTFRGIAIATLAFAALGLGACASTDDGMEAPEPAPEMEPAPPADPAAPPTTDPTPPTEAPPPPPPTEGTP